MVAAWPTTVNTTNFASYGEALDTNITQFKPDVGPPKQRRRMSLSSDTVQFTMIMTATEWHLFRAFFKTTLKDGTLPFTFPRPRNGTIEQWTFNGNAPSAKFSDYNLYEVSIALQSVPNTDASWLPLLTVGSAVAPSIAPDIFPDFTTEGSTDPHYWVSGVKYTSFARWLAALGGTYTRASAANYFKSGLLVSATSGTPRFPTDGSGNATGLRLTGAQTELCLWNRDLTNASWTKTNGTAVKDQTGIDGVISSASRFTATSANATVTQAITSASALRVTGFWLKRLVGTGTIQISQDNGTTPTTVVPTASWVFYPITPATLTNPTLWIKIATNADSIAIDFASHRLGSIIADPIATTTATVTQAADVLSFPFSGSTFSAYLKMINQTFATGTFQRLIGFDLAANQPAALFLEADTKISTFNGTVGGRTLSGPTITSALNGHKSMASGSPSGSSVTSDGLIPLSDANPIAISTPTRMSIGNSGDTASFAFGDFSQLAIWNNFVASSADLVRLTT